MYKEFLSPIEEVIEDARNGKMFVLVDAEDRENEGDLVIPAQMATPETVNFMAKYGRGLICLSMNSDRAKQLNLELMSSVAIDPTKGATDIVSPGHVFPLVARDGGVLVRAGHTEAAVDISRLAGLYPAGVICEIMNDDGTMARLPDLVQFAQLHGLKIATIADLIAYRRRHDNLIHRAIETEIESEYGGTFNLNVYLNTAEYAEHIALTMGDLTTPEPALVRMHAINVFDDMLGAKGGRNNLIEDSMRTIAKEGRGVIVLIRDTTATVVSDMLLHKGESEEQGPRRLREYGVGAQILLDLGVHDMILMSDTPRQIVGLEGYGLRVVEQRSVDGEKVTSKDAETV
mgnify:CR=1 FL=1